MATNFPNSLDNSTSLPYPSSFDDTNSPSLAGGQDNQNDAIIAAQTKLGINTSAASAGSVLLGVGPGESQWGSISNAYTSGSTGTGNFVLANTPTITGAILNTPAINNPTLKTDSVIGFTTPDSGTLYGISVSSSKFSGSVISNGSITGANIAMGTITGSNIAANTITGNNLIGMNLFGLTSAAFGSAPPAMTGQFYMQAGSSVVAVNSGGTGSVFFPASFPGGVVTVTITSGDITQPNAIFNVIGDTVGASAFAFYTPNFNNASVRINWIAIGF